MTTTRICVTVLLGATLCACGQSEPTSTPAPQEPAAAVPPAAIAAAPEVQQHPLREVLFGDLHVHTSWSTDAYTGGNRVGPDDAYRFARGDAVVLPNGIRTRLDVPLDFVALTDHAEGFSTTAACQDPNHPQYESRTCQRLRSPPGGGTQGEYLRGAFATGAQRPPPRNPELCADVEQCLANSRSTWQRVQAAANEFNDPGRFTTLIGYEFSALLDQFGMLHRNVVFRGSEVIPHAIASQDVVSQADFLRQLDAACQSPCQVLTIPHNTNYSWGATFSRTDEGGVAYTAEDRERRMRIDRLVEVAQIKGESECQVGVGTTDEDCGFEKMFAGCETDQTGRCATEASFVRHALLEGITLANEGQRNMFKYGMVGATDTHASDPGNTDPRNRFAQARGDAAAVKQALEAQHLVVGPIRRTSPGALAAVWAESNTRADIFDALQRREAFATSGSRLRVRFFAGSLPADIVQLDDALEVAYATGVPMGGDLDTGLEAPSFWVWAMQDPNGPTLDRIQIVKGWVEEGETRHRVWDAACAGREPDEQGRCAPTTASVDTGTCARADADGGAQLQSVFQDPTYDPGQHAFYYVRVFENPSCRWTTWLANSAGVATPDDVPATVQNRAWSSPIWVEPR